MHTERDNAYAGAINVAREKAQWTLCDESVHVHTLTMSNENLQTWAIHGLSEIWEFVAVHTVPDRGQRGLRALKNRMNQPAERPSSNLDIRKIFVDFCSCKQHETLDDELLTKTPLIHHASLFNIHLLPNFLRRFIVTSVLLDLLACGSDFTVILR